MSAKQHLISAAKDCERSEILIGVEAALASVVAALATDEPNTFPAIVAAAMAASKQLATIAVKAALVKSDSDSIIANKSKITAHAAAALAAAEIYGKLSQEMVEQAAIALVVSGSLLEGPRTAATAAMNRPYTTIQTGNIKINERAAAKGLMNASHTSHGNAALAPLQQHQHSNNWITYGNKNRTTATGLMSGSHALSANGSVSYDPRIPSHMTMQQRQYQPECKCDVPDYVPCISIV